MEETMHGPAVMLDMEKVIRDLAGTVISSIDNRRSHPSYGTTKSIIRSQYDRMEGAIGMYMVVSKQATHAGVPILAKFLDHRTADRVNHVRRLWGEL